MDQKYELNMDQMEQVTGGVERVVNTGTTDKAAVRCGPGTGYGWVISLVNGTKVDTVTDQSVFDPVSNRNFVEIRYKDKNGETKTGWIAASIVGLPR